MQRGGVLPALEVSRFLIEKILLNCHLNLKLGYSFSIGLYLRQTKILMFTQACNYVRRAGFQGIPHVS